MDLGSEIPIDIWVNYAKMTNVYIQFTFHIEEFESG